MPVLYIIAGGLMILWPLIATIRCREWEVKKMRAGESRLLGFLYVPVLVVMAFLGIMMLVLGSEVLKGTIQITL
jgi:hypothetical protein